MSEYFVLFPNCIPVRGVIRTAVCDLHKRDIHFMPNNFCDLLQRTAHVPRIEFGSIFSSDELQIVEDSIGHLITLNLGCYTSTPSIFAKMNLEFERPNRLSNAIITLTHDSIDMFEKSLKQLSDLGCEAVEVRAFSCVQLLQAHGGNVKDLYLKRILK